MKAIIIEDETAAVRNLKAILHEVAPETEVIATLDSISQSVAWLSANAHPDIIFMDIHLADGESFLIFDQVEIDVPVVFTTAYDEYALKAFKVNSIDYLLKPIKPEELSKAITKYKKNTYSERDAYIERLSKLTVPKRYIETLLIFYKDKIIPLNINTIACFYSQNEKTQVITFQNEIYPVDKSLNTLTEILNPEMFYRANRQYIVSRGAIQEISIWVGGRLDVMLNISLKKQILISKERVSEFKKWLQNRWYIN